VWQVEVWLETTLADALQQTRQPRACFEEAEGGVLYRVDVEDLPWMARLLAGLGVRFIVHRPRELCEVVRQYARALADYAERSEAKRDGASGG
jgi:predicted DNA-binding transcriptional regulator YafY